MRESDAVGLIILGILLIGLVFVAIAVTAGNIVNQLLAPVPGYAGPMGAAASLIVFVVLVFKLAELIFK